MAGGGEVHGLLLAVHIDIMGLVVLIAAVGLEGASSGVEVNVVAVAGLALIDEDDLSNAVGGPGIDGPEEMCIRDRV